MSVSPARASSTHQSGLCSTCGRRAGAGGASWAAAAAAGSPWRCDVRRAQGRRARCRGRTVWRWRAEGAGTVLKRTFVAGLGCQGSEWYRPGTKPAPVRPRYGAFGVAGRAHMVRAAQGCTGGRGCTKCAGAWAAARGPRLVPLPASQHARLARHAACAGGRAGGWAHGRVGTWGSGRCAGGCTLR